MFTFERNREEREEKNEVQMGKGHTAAWASGRGKQKITLYKKPDANLFCHMCLCSRNQRNSSTSSDFFSKSWASLAFCTVLSSGSPKASPLFQWSSTDPRILLLMSCCTNPTHTAGLSAHTLVLLETFILKKEKRKRTKNESNLSDYIPAAELPVKKTSQHMCSCFSVYTRIYCEAGT